MKTLIALLATLIVSFPAYAADNACVSQATEKKLAGAAKTSFIKNCVRDGCEASSLGKKLAGAAKNSFTKKCLADGLQPFCEEQATGKKLSGAAKTIPACDTQVASIIGSSPPESGRALP